MKNLTEIKSHALRQRDEVLYNLACGLENKMDSLKRACGEGIVELLKIRQDLDRAKVDPELDDEFYVGMDTTDHNKDCEVLCNINVLRAEVATYCALMNLQLKVRHD